MQPEQCIFCAIVSQKISVPIIAHNDDIIVINDINPKAPIHYLLITKKHIHSLQSMEHTDSYLATSLLLMAQNLTAILPSTSCRLIMNNGTPSGQSVFHMHMHLLSGKTMTDF